MTISFESFETEFPEAMRVALREPIARTSADRRASVDRIMGAIESTAIDASAAEMPTSEARPRRRLFLTPSMSRSRWRRRGLLSPIGGAVTTLMMVLTVMLRLDQSGPSGSLDAFARVVGDSVVPAFDSSVVTGVSANGHWLDTLRIVELVLRGPGVHSASAIGAFNRWQHSGTPLTRVAMDEWRARVLVPRDALPYASRVAVMVNDTRLIPTSTR